MLDLAIHNGTVVLPDYEARVDVGILNGSVVELTESWTTRCRTEGH